VVTPEILVDEAVKADHQLALEQALSVAEVTSSIEDPRLRYALQVQDRIAKALRYPEREKELNLEGTVKLKLHLFSDGTLGRAMVSKSSGIESLDAEALKVAESQAPYPQFPGQLPERELWLEIPVIFRP
jgi:TonB family protein